MILIMPRQLLVFRAIGRAPSGLSAMECGAASSTDEKPEYGPLGQERYGRFLADHLKDLGMCRSPVEGRYVITPEGAAWLVEHPVCP